MKQENIWLTFLRLYQDRQITVIFFLGISCGLPHILIGSTFHFWLAQEGVSYCDIGYLSLIGLPYTLKFLWAPLIDQWEIPYLTAWLGRRRAWLFFCQINLMILLMVLSCLDPRSHLLELAIVAGCVSFMAALQDITMLVYQVERLRMSSYGAGEAVGIFGYRVGLLMGGAGALYFSSLLSWTAVYHLMGLGLGIGLITTLCCQESSSSSASKKIIKGISNHLKQAFIDPLKDFKSIPHWVLILFIMFLYKLGDNFIGSWPNQYYLSLGFTKIDIANASKIFGMVSSVIGGYIGGVILYRFGILKSLFWLAALHGVAMGGYLLLGFMGKSLPTLYFTVALEDITGGMRITALFAFQMMLCAHRGYAATQLAILTSLVHLGRVLFSTPAGWILEQTNWQIFFSIGIILNIIPLILLVKIFYQQKD